jgi:hypothetical protein
MTDNLLYAPQMLASVEGLQTIPEHNLEEISQVTQMDDLIAEFKAFTLTHGEDHSRHLTDIEACVLEHIEMWPGQYTSKEISTRLMLSIEEVKRALLTLKKRNLICIGLVYVYYPGHNSPLSQRR